jgi:hypothetical protein
MASKLTRGVLPLLTALVAVPVLALPANARVSGPASRTAPPAGDAPPVSNAQWWLSPLNAPQAWEAAPEQGAGVTVAVLSTGAGPGQPGPAESVISSVAPRARILPVPVPQGLLPDAIEYAVSHGAKVIDLPGAAGAGTGGGSAGQAAMRDALARDVVLAAPAGGRQPYATLTPPGAGLTVAAPSGRPVSAGKNQTMPAAGLASALAAGVAALARSRYPKLTATQITQAMQHGATPANPGGTGPGMLNASGTVTSAASTFALIGNGLPNPAPAWNDYVTKRGEPKAGPGLALWYGAAGAGALVVLALVSVPVLLLVRRRRRAESGERPASGAQEPRTRQLRPAHPGPAQPEAGHRPDAPGPAHSSAGYAADRAAVASALVGRSRAIRPPQEVPDDPRNVVPTGDISPRLSRDLRRGGP